MIKLAKPKSPHLWESCHAEGPKQIVVSGIARRIFARSFQEKRCHLVILLNERLWNKTNAPKPQASVTPCRRFR